MFDSLVSEWKLKPASTFVCEYRIDIGQTAPDGTPVKTDRFAVGLHRCEFIGVGRGVVVVRLGGTDAAAPMTIYLTPMGPAIYREPHPGTDRKEPSNARKTGKALG